MPNDIMFRNGMIMLQTLSMTPMSMLSILPPPHLPMRNIHLQQLTAGKPVYVEKPMTVNFASAIKMMNAANEKNAKLVIAHYRREQPYFKKIKQLLDEKFIGDIRFARLDFYRKLLLQGRT